MLGRLLLKFCVLLTVVGAIEFAFLVNPAGRELVGQPLLKAWRTKHEALNAAGAGRLLLVGGSNLAFGVDSDRLEAATGRKTINLGLHGGLGLALMLNEAVAGARSGDLIVLSPEYSHFYGNLLYGEVTLAELIQCDQGPLRFFSFPWHWLSLARNATPVATTVAFAGINYLKVTVRGGSVSARPIDPVYRPDGFNERGDMIAHLDLPQRPERRVLGTVRIDGDFNPEAVRSIERAAQKLERHGVKLIVTYPAVSASYWKLNQDAAERVESALPRQLVTTTAAEWVFPDAWFFDTPYHLTRQGRAARTELLLRMLKPVDRRASSAVE